MLQQSDDANDDLAPKESSLPNKYVMLATVVVPMAFCGAALILLTKFIP